MKVFNSLYFFLVFLSFSWSCKPQSNEWSGNALEIYNARQISNDALKEHDLVKELSLMIDSVQITTGNGTMIRGKEMLRQFITSIPDARMYWVRTPDEIDVNTELELAWESGTWKGFNPEKGSEPVSGGKYAAQWIREDGAWKIKSELFVTLN